MNIFAMSDEKISTPHELSQMTWLLMEDVMRCWNELHKATTKEDQNFWKRAFTRSVFAQIEGFTEFFRSQALTVEFNKLISKISAGGEFSLHPGLLSVLAGESFFITDDGEMRSHAMRTPFLPNLLFCFNSFAEAHGVHARIKKGDAWNKIQSAVRVRDGLMHPKTPKSLEISGQEIEDVVFTLKWFYQQLHFIMKKDSPDEDFKEFPEHIFTLKLKKF
jgi:hypothetical protein